MYDIRSKDVSSDIRSKDITKLSTLDVEMDIDVEDLEKLGQLPRVLLMATVLTACS